MMGTSHSRYIPRLGFHSQVSEEYSQEIGTRYCLPEVLLIEILSFVPASDLLKNCCRVCIQWKDLIAGHGIWKQKCLLEGKLIPHHIFDTIPKHYYRLIYLKNPYGRNLLKNPHGKERFKYWTLRGNGGEGWEVEEPPKGADAVPLEAGSQSCFVTSYDSCTKFQLIDLLAEGVNEEILDDVRPKISIGEWYAARFDCGSIYKLKVLLLGEREDVVLDTFEYGPYREQQWTGRAWSQVTHTFKDYPPGVRFIAFEHSGNDTQYWAGHYGSKMSGGFVKFDFT